jgi:hypothetical protein
MMRSVGAFSLSFSTTDMEEKAKGDDEFGDIAECAEGRAADPERGDLKIFSAGGGYFISPQNPPLFFLANSSQSTSFKHSL